MSIRVKHFIFSDFGENTYVVVDENTRQAAVIDPAMTTPEERERFDKYIADAGLELVKIFNTHMHLDHIFGANYVKQKYGAPLYAHPADASLGLGMAEQCQRFGYRFPAEPVAIDFPLADGDDVTVGDSKLRVLHVPGHSPGSVAFYSPEGNILFSGDTLFRCSIGRTDLLGGDQRQLVDSIHRKLFPLPEATTVLPGHDRPTTIGDERKFNPFL